MKFEKDIQTINETITSINNLDFGNDFRLDNGTVSNKRKTKKENLPDKEKLFKRKPVKQVHPWLWQLISVTLGVDPQRRENPGVISSILELLTMGSALSNID